MRFSNGQGFTSNQQFGVVSDTQAFGGGVGAPPPPAAAPAPAPPPQQGNGFSFSDFPSPASGSTLDGSGSTVFRQSPQRFPPPSDGRPVLSGFAISSPQGVQSSNAFNQAFGRDQQQQEFVPATPSSSQNGFSPLFEDPAPPAPPSLVPQPAIPVQQVEEVSNVRVRPLSDGGAVEQPRTRGRVPVVVASREVVDEDSSSNRFRGRRPVAEIAPEEEQAQEEDAFTSFHSDPFQTDFVSGPPRPRGTKLPVNTPRTPTRKPPSPSSAPTPPRSLSRVRGRPIVPEDFPGPTAAVRAPLTTPTPSIPEEEEKEEDKSPRRFLSRTRLGRPGVRIIPTGKRARRPVLGDRQKEVTEKPTPVPVPITEPPKEEPAPPADLPETPRASSVSSGRLNRVSLDNKPTTGSSGRRRFRPSTSLLNRNRALVTPRRRLRPLGDRPKPTKAPETVSVAPSSRRKPAVPDPASSSFFKPTESSTTTRQRPRGGSPAAPSTASPIDALHTTKALAFDPNILIAQVQATKADDERGEIGATGGRPSKIRGSGVGRNPPVIDDSEESNIIPFSDVAVPAVPPSAEGAPTAVGGGGPFDSPRGTDEQTSLDDADITVINLQRDKGKQNFKGFVDTDLIDDSLRHREDDGHGHHPFIPTRSPIVTAPPPPPTTTPEPPRTTGSPGFIPTSLPVFSSSTEGNSRPVSINDKLDRLQSNLDPWAHIQREKEQQEQQETVGPTTTQTTATTRPSLFRIRTHAPKTTTQSTTTFRPRSLADLFKHRNGQKIIYTEQAERPPSSSPSQERNRGRPAPLPKTTTENVAGVDEERLSRIKDRLDRFKAATSSTTQRGAVTTPTTPLPSFNPSLFATTTRNIILTGFRSSSPATITTTERKTTARKEFFSTTTSASTSSTTTREKETEAPTTTTVRSEPSTTTSAKKQTVKDLLSKIPKDSVAAFLPPGYQARAPTTAPPPESSLTTTTEATTKKSAAKQLFEGLEEDDVSSFLPPGYRQTTTSTESSTSLLKDILSSIEEIDESLLPPGFKQPSRGFKPKGTSDRKYSRTTTARTTTTTTTEEATTKKSSNLFDKVRRPVPKKAGALGRGWRVDETD